MIKWIFFDIGNVILNDDPAMAELYKHIYDVINQNGINITFDELLYHREQSILKYREGRHYRTVAIKFLGETRWKHEFKSILKKLRNNWEKLSPLVPGVIPVIQKLHERFNLGLLANQPQEVVTILKKHQLMQYFKVNAISAIVGHQKPDTRIFEYALEAADCNPEDAIMIGDRVDNDVVPAKAVGMKTIWLKLPLDLKGYEPISEFEKSYLRSIRRASVSQMSPHTIEEQPDFTAESFADILKGINYTERNNDGRYQK